MQSRAIQESEVIARSRLLMFEQSSGSVSLPFLTVLVFRIGVLSLGFGLFARFNATVTASLFVGALSVAGAIFLILELNQPYRGLMQISDEPLRSAIAQIDRESDVAFLLEGPSTLVQCPPRVAAGKLCGERRSSLSRRRCLVRASHLVQHASEP